jgi:predicted AAA+ superfamily ATPase
MPDFLQPRCVLSPLVNDYWAPAGGIETEVDFLLQRNREFVAVEAKSGRIFSEKWCKGLRAIADLKGLQRRIVVYPHGPVLRTDDGIDVFPFDLFAGLLAENRLWGENP